MERSGRAERREVLCGCPAGHAFTLTLAAEAQVPPVWDCRRCGRPAHRPGAAVSVESDDAEVPARHLDSTWAKSVRSAAQTTSPRTPWIMLTERRTREELQALLDERLALLRAGCS